MTPYYQDEAVTIYHGDCREILPDVDADAVVTDPPYGMNHYRSDRNMLTTDLLLELIKKGPAAVFGYPERLVALCVGAQVRPDEWVTWWPTNAAIKAFNLAGLLNEVECVAIFGKHRFSTLRSARSARSARLLEKYERAGIPSGRQALSDGEPASRRLSDVWTDAAPGLAFQSHRRLHPNEKPIQVCLRLVEGLSSPGETILDPFMGSGTTLRAAKDLGRKAIGIEIEERYCEIAARRMGQEVLSL